MLDPAGFTKVIHHVAGQTFGANDARLRLNELVTEVHFALENDQYVPNDLRNDGVFVKTASGRAYWARFCVITFPVRYYATAVLYILYECEYSTYEYTGICFIFV